MKGINHRNVKIKFKLKKKERKIVKSIVKKGVENARVIRRANIILNFDSSKTSPEISQYVHATAETVRSIGKKYMDGGIQNALYDAPRPGKERLLSEKESSRIIAMVCTDPPEGRSRWTIELIVEEAKKRKIVSKVGRETIRILLKTHDLKPWREKNVVYPGINA
jgi:hypothetical protein